MNLNIIVPGGSKPSIHIFVNTSGAAHEKKEGTHRTVGHFEGFQNQANCMRVAHEVSQSAERVFRLCRQMLHFSVPFC